MNKKKVYAAPECVAYVLPSGSLCQMKVSGTEITERERIGFSKGFSGGIEDDEEPKSSNTLWGEE
jgi:hypothetical protein